MTIPLYLNDTYLFNSQSIILDVAKDSNGTFIILDKTIFYPQGGGQPADQGMIKTRDFEININLVRQIDGEIRHYTEHLPKEIIINSKIDSFLDKDRRLLNSRYHTAAHSLSNITEILYPEVKAVKGNSFPDGAYVEF